MKKFSKKEYDREHKREKVAGEYKKDFKVPKKQGPYKRHKKYKNVVEY